MQVTEIAAEGLKREYRVVVPADDIEARVGARLEELRRTIKMPGFRPGKVPIGLLRKQYGRSVMGEVLEQEVSRTSQEALTQQEIKPALQPKIEITAFDEGKDLEFKMALEVLPEVPTIELEPIELTRPVTEVDDEAVERALETFVKRNQAFEPLAESRPAAEGDQVVLDFEGKKDGEPFAGGKGEDFPLMLGSGTMVPGFEAALIGRTEGEQAEIEVTFPDDYPREELKGQPVTFDVKIKEVKAPVPLVIDDELAKGQGFESLDAMRDAIRTSMNREYSQFSRLRVKRSLLDHLAERYRFEVPPGMVEMEFDAIWKQVEHERSHGHAADQPEEELRAEYQEIAERRVRLGLILSAIGQANEIKVESQELNAALVDQARRYPGQEQQVIEYFKANPQAIEQLRAPIYEDKVVDFVLQVAKVTDQPVTAEELLRDPDETDEAAPAAEGAA
jgi:trigger factor